jgi:uncharacterized protein YutE (UPF0331/DUF86 family)
MDGYQFVAALVGSLAWPAVVGVLLYLLREQLTGLAERLQELSLPGGMKATFEKELRVGREIVEQIPSQPPPPQLAPPAPEEENKLYRLAIESPEGAIVLAYIDLEKKLRDIAIKLGMGPKVTNQRSIMEKLVERDLITREASRLFDSLRRARNSAAHAAGEEPVTSQDALEFIRQVSLLLALLHVAEEHI